MTDQWDNLVFNVTAKTLDVMKAATIQTGQQVISAWPVDTGVSQNSWNTAIGAMDKSIGLAQQNGGQEAKNRLVATVSNAELGQEIYFTNSTPYALPLEFGHSQQAPSGALRLAVARWPLTVAEVTRELKK